VDVRIVTDGQWPDETDVLLHALPEWFGIEESVRAYVNAARTLPTVAAQVDGEIVGVCLVRRHTLVAAEIELLAVRRDLHRAGVGRRLVERAVVDLTSTGVKLLQVKTLGPSGEPEEYARTRAFYEAIGFLPLEERTDV
jgi:N-acetylglutamate synthase-like GNAT family acetyltransferase